MRPEATKVQCDEPGCGWIQDLDFSDIPQWHNKPCPKCNKGVVVNDEDLLTYNLVMAVMHLTDAIDPKREKREEGGFILDTSTFRTHKAL